jgi:hypothetical protein
MLLYYLKLTLRNFRNTIGASLTNVIGLSVGFTIVFFIAVWVYGEFTYDHFHSRSKDIYLLASRQESEATFREYSPFVRPRPDLFAKYPEVNATVGVVPLDKAAISNGGRSFSANGIGATRSFFETFNFPFTAGSYESYSDSTKVIYLTETLAYKIFNGTDVIGKTIDFNFSDSLDNGLIVAGVLADPPTNSSIQFEFIVPYYARSSWGKMDFCYLLMSPHADIPAFKTNIKLIGREGVGFLNSPTSICTIVPLTDIYFHSNFSQFAHGNILYVWVMMIAGAVLLLVIVASHINLTSSLIAGRSKELGVRRIMGSQKFDLHKQFILESFLFIILALAGVVLLSSILLDDFYSIIQRRINLTTVFSGWGWLLVPGIALACLLSGIVLARFFNHVSPLALLKGESGRNLKLSTFKDRFMVVQLIVAVAGIAVTIGLNVQLDLMISKDPGYEKENIVKVNLTTHKRETMSQDQHIKLNDFIDGQLSNSSVIVDFDRGVFPTDVSTFPWQFDPTEDAHNVAMLTVGSNFFNLFGLEMVEGNAVVEYGSFVVVNESAVRTFGISNPIGYKIKNTSWGEFQIAGIVEDFHFESSGLAIKPLVIVCLPYPERPLIAKIPAGRTREGLEFLEDLNATINPGMEFTYQFFDETFDRIYRRDIVLARIFNIAAAVAILLSMLGMFSLVLVFTREKTAEIGIRKVFGAGTIQITGLIGYHFLKRLAVAFVAGSAIAWFALYKWLENFAYKIELGWWIFILSGIMVFVLAQLTMGWQIIKAATANPVDSLRHH